MTIQTFPPNRENLTTDSCGIHPQGEVGSVAAFFIRQRGSCGWFARRMALRLSDLQKKKSEASASLFGLVKHIKQCGVAVRVRSEGLFYQHGNRGESLRVFGFESVGNVVLKVVAEAFAGPY